VKQALTVNDSDRSIESAQADRRATVMQVTWSLVAGGAEMYALTVASNLDPEKYRSVLCAVDQGGALESEVRRRGLPYFVMDRRPGIELGLMWRLYCLFRRFRVRVVHTHHFNQLFYSLAGALLVGAKIIHTEHSVEAFKRRRLRIALRLLALFCKKVVAIGEDGARVLSDEVGIPKKKLEIIRAGLDVRAFDEPRQQARSELGLTESDRVAVIIARLFPEKNHRLLLEAFAEVARAAPAARLMVAGEGVEQEAIEDQITRLGLSRQVRLLGVRRDVARLLAASDVFVLSSDREGLPIAVLEAMAASRPVVATSVGDLPLVVRNGVNGLLVERGDQAALADAITSILGDDLRAEAMGREGRRLVAENFSLRSMIDRLERIYSG
jgi:L-malate glycosyltransferase